MPEKGLIGGLMSFVGEFLGAASRDSKNWLAGINVGSKVRVTRVRDRIPAELVTTLKADCMGTVKEFKPVDGQGIGVLVELNSGPTMWFFGDEITAA